MPTAGRLAAAILFGLLALCTTSLVVPLLPESRQLDWFLPVNALAGIWAGWVVAGARAGRRYDGRFVFSWAGAAGYGLTAMVAMVFWALFAHALGQMIRLALRQRYDTPVEAIAGIFALMAVDAQAMYTSMVASVLIVGGAAAGLVTEFIGRRYS